MEAEINQVVSSAEITWMQEFKATADGNFALVPADIIWSWPQTTLIYADGVMLLPTSWLAEGGFKACFVTDLNQNTVYWWGYMDPSCRNGLLWFFEMILEGKKQKNWLNLSQLTVKLQVQNRKCLEHKRT